MKKLLIANRKGGVGKTTTASALAYFAAQNNKKCILLDLDTQGHLQYTFGFKKEFKTGLHKALSSGKIDDLIVKTQLENIDIIPASINFDSSTLKNSKKLLKPILESLEDRYDFCIIDTPPTSDVLVSSSMYLSDAMLLPMSVEPAGLIGTMQFLKMVYQKSEVGKICKFLGVLPTRYNKSLIEHRGVLNELEKIVGKSRVLNPIKQDIAIANLFKNSIFSFENIRSRAMIDYEKLYRYISATI